MLGCGLLSSRHSTYSLNWEESTPPPQDAATLNPFWNNRSSTCIWKNNNTPTVNSGYLCMYDTLIAPKEIFCLSLSLQARLAFWEQGGGSTTKWLPWGLGPITRWLPWKTRVNYKASCFDGSKNDTCCVLPILPAPIEVEKFCFGGKGSEYQETHWQVSCWQSLLYVFLLDDILSFHSKEHEAFQQSEAFSNWRDSDSKEGTLRWRKVWDLVKWCGTFPLVWRLYVG